MANFRNFRKERARVRLLTLASALAISTALSTVSVADDQGQEAIVFEIQAQPLASALNAFSKQSGFVVLGAPDFLAGKKSNSVSARLEPSEALTQMLKGTGLTFRLSGEGTITIMREDAAPQADGNENPESAARKEISGFGSVSGTVQDAFSGNRLVGALIRIKETGQAVATDEKGNFRFPKVASGSRTIIISYLGYAAVESEIALGGGESFVGDYQLDADNSFLDEIVIFGSRSSRSIALNQERTADNSSSVVSSDMMGDFVGTTISEALRRVPGVTFRRDALTGAGTNIMVRGVSPDMNAVKLNGLNLPSTNAGAAVSRSADLSNIMADTVEKVTIHKTLLPSHDSAGTGGLIEIETRSPLSRPDQQFNMTVERGMRAHDFADDFLASGTVSKKFGSDKNFGVSASVQYRKSSNNTIGLGKSLAFGSYLPLEADGSLNIFNRLQVDPRFGFPFDGGDDKVYTIGTDTMFTDVDDETLALTLSAEWQVTENTELRFDLTRSETTRDMMSSSVNISNWADYMPMPISSLDGELRNGLAFLGDARVGMMFSSSEDGKNETNTYSFRGTTRKDLWEFNYTLGYTQGKDDIPNTRNISLTSQAAIPFSEILSGAMDADEGRIISMFGRYQDGYQFPYLSDAAWGIVNDPDGYTFNSGNLITLDSKNRVYEAKLSARRELEGKTFKFVEVGLDYKNSKNTDNTTLLNYLGMPQFIFDPCCSAQYPSAADLGVYFDGRTLSRIGFDSNFLGIAAASVDDFFANAPSLVGGFGSPLFKNEFTPSDLERDVFLKEESFAGYLQGRMDIGKMEIVGGVRFDHVRVSTAQLFRPEVTDIFGTPDVEFQNEYTSVELSEATQTNFLPRVSFNYRENENLIFRGGYYLSVARPSISLMAQETDVYLQLAPFGGPNWNQPTLSVNMGNPDLKPAYTHNFDISAEYYNDQIGVIKVSAFYKTIKNLLQTSFTQNSSSLEGIDLPDHPYFTDLPEDIYITVAKPENNPYNAHVWGLEFHVERQLTFLPGAWGGLGVYANYTYTKSEKTFDEVWSSAPVYDEDGNFLMRQEEVIQYRNIPFAEQVPHSGTAAITYSMHGIDASLSYTYQSRKQSIFAPHNLHAYDEDTSSLDFRFEYRFGGEKKPYRFYVEGANLLDGSKDADLMTSLGGYGGTPKYIDNMTYLGGRAFKLGLTINY